MHFGRLDNLDGVDLGFPAEPLRTHRFLALARQEPLTLYIGCPIWAERKWVGSLYPKGLKSQQFLPEYSRHFNTVEVNSTFYQLLSPVRIAAWRDQVPAGFKFCPKVYRGISEGLSSPDLPRLINQYAQAVGNFGDTLGVVFAQLPESIGPSQGALLRRLLSLWPTASLPLAIEFRHPGWFRQHALLDDAVNLLYRHQVATVVTDTPGRRDVLHLSLTQPRLLVRFQGHLLAPSDQHRLNDWRELFRRWSGANIKEAYLFTHQPGEELIPATASLFQSLCSPAPTTLCLKKNPLFL